MNRILACPHCGPMLSDARLRCDRCGRELVYVGEAEFSGRQEAAAAGPPPDTASRSRTRRWVVAAVAASVVLATAGLLTPGGHAPDPAAPGGGAALPEAAVAPAAPVRAPAVPGRAEAVPPEPADAIVRPGDLAQALEHYRAALAEQPADAVLLDNVGQILVVMNRPADAVPFLEQAVAAEPFSVTARFDLAVAYARSGKLKEAVEQYATLAQSGSADARVHHNLGLALRQLGRHAEAAGAFERATALAPGEASGWLGLALSLEADGRGVEAASALDRVLALEPGRADADNVRARIARLRAPAEPSAPPPDTGSGPSRRRP